MRSVDPTTSAVLATWTPHTSEEVEARLARAAAAAEAWRFTQLSSRAEPLLRLADLLEERAGPLGLLMTREMGKPIRQAEGEIRKCAGVCRYYATNAESLLEPEPIDVGSDGAVLRCDPIGVILSIMPWNFPFWQVLRFAAPALMAGNAVLVKHAENTIGCSTAIRELLLEAGFPVGLFDHVVVEVDRVAEIVADARVAAVTLTGSERAGQAVAATAGAHLKKTVLELGGSDPFLVLGDADLSLAVRGAVDGRVQNSGQSCVAAKRFIVVDALHDRFVAELTEAMEALRVGDPKLPETEIGPLARPDLVDTLAGQVLASVAAGARITTGGTRNGNFYAPTVLVDVPLDCPAATEELFGPVAAVFRVPDEDAAVDLANRTAYGLAASIWTAEPARGLALASRLRAGGVFVNRIPISDPRTPFGGIKASGYGRELGRAGIMEFVNLKTVRWTR